MARTRIKSSSIDTTTGAGLPVGTTAQRPVNPAVGTMRLNTTTQCVEVYYSGFWAVVSSVAPTFTADVLAVAGGGAGGNGGGGGYNVTKGLGGSGVGGNGGLDINSTNSTAGASNTGSGGGGGAGNTGSSGRNGGSGVVIIRYLGAPRSSGGTVTQSGGYTIHTFTESSVLIVS